MIVFVTGEQPDSTPERRLERLRELPLSSKLVYKVLEADPPLTQGQIRERALLPARTTRDALAKLDEANLIDERTYIPDARKRLYAPLSVSEPSEDGETE